MEHTKQVAALAAALADVWCLSQERTAPHVADFNVAEADALVRALAAHGAVIAPAGDLQFTDAPASGRENVSLGWRLK